MVIRSCWDYHKRAREFLSWIEQTEKAGVKLFNSAKIICWNLEKTYLRELAEKGVKIPATIWFEKGEKGNLEKILRENNWRKAVLKPTISATAWQTFVVAPENADDLQPEFENLLADGGVMIQKFVEEIQTKGEWSFMFFDKKFSHAVLKRAKNGDFRVQDNFGGSVETNLKPPLGLIVQARKLIEMMPEDLLYARVDAVEIDGELTLMELELIEPVLFLKEDTTAARKFAEAIANRIKLKKAL